MDRCDDPPGLLLTPGVSSPRAGLSQGSSCEDAFAAIRKAAEADGVSRGLVIVISALRETITECKAEKDGEPSATEYLAAIIPALEGSDQSRTPQLLALLATVMPHAHKSLLRLKFPAIYAVLSRLLRDHDNPEEDSEADVVLQHLVRCMGFLLAAQESNPAVWGSPRVLGAFHALLHRIADGRVRVRRAANEAVAVILTSYSDTTTSKTHKLSSNKRSPAVQTAEFCRAVITSCTNQDVARALYLLQFMRSTVPMFPAEQACSLSRLALHLLSVSSAPLTAGVMQMLSAVVQSPQPCLTAPFLAKLTRELLDMQPSRSSGAGAVSFASLMGSCIVRLQGMDPEASISLLPHAILALVDYCESSLSAVHTASCGALNLMFQTCVTQDMVLRTAVRGRRSSDRSLPEGNQDDSARKAPLVATLSALESLLQYRFQGSWQKSLPLLGRLFLHLKGASYPVLVGVLRGLGELHDALTSVPSAALPGVTSALNEALGFAIEGMGPERVLGVLPLAPTGATSFAEGGVAEARAWLLPLLAEHAKAAPTRLAFFQSHVLELAKKCDVTARSGKLTVNEACTQQYRVVQLWGLLPSFCANPTDVATSLGSLAPVLDKAMSDARYPGILAEVCAGLEVLVTGVKSRAEGSAGGSQDPKADLQKLTGISTKFLPKLFALVQPYDGGVKKPDSNGEGAKSTVRDGSNPMGPSAITEKAMAVARAVATFASVAPTPYVSSLFKKLLHKMLEATAAATAVKDIPAASGDAGKGDVSPKEEALSRAQVLLELAAGLAPSLADKDTSLLYRAVKPMLHHDASPHVQKRAYKVILALCAEQPKYMSSPEVLPDVLELFTSSLLTCSISARVMRLQCLSRLVASFTPGDPIYAPFLPALTKELVLCTKDSNGRARELAYHLIVLLGTTYRNPSGMIRVVLGELSATSPHARSAAVLALSRLQLEFGHFRSERWDAAVADMMPELTRKMLLLLEEPSKEVVRAVLGWLRVAIGGADRELMKPIVKDVVVAIMSGASAGHKDHFRVKIRGVLSKLCRKFGFDEIKSLMPEEDKKLISHMKATAEREIKLKKSRLGDEASGTAKLASSRTSGMSVDTRGISKAIRKFDALRRAPDTDTDDESDPGDEQTRDAGGRRNSRKTGGMGMEMRVRERGEDGTSVVDLLDPSMVRNMQSKGATRRGARDGEQASDSDDGFDFDSDDDDDEGEIGFREGKIVVPHEKSDDKKGSERGGTTRKRARGGDGNDDDDDGDDHEEVVDTGKNADGFVHIAGRRARAKEETAGASGRSRAQGQQLNAQGTAVSARKRQKTTTAVRGMATGAEFRSKKAGGDVKRKGAKLEPYAYVPLDGRTLMGKHSRSKALKQYETVVRPSGRSKKGNQKRSAGQHRKR